MDCDIRKEVSFGLHFNCRRGSPDSSVGKESACNAGDPGSIPGSGRSTGEGIGYPLQYSGLENSMDYLRGPKELDTTEPLSLLLLMVGSGLQAQKEERYIRSEKALLDTDLERARKHNVSDKGLGVRAWHMGKQITKCLLRLRKDLHFNLNEKRSEDRVVSHSMTLSDLVSYKEMH